MLKIVYILICYNYFEALRIVKAKQEYVPVKLLLSLGTDRNFPSLVTLKCKIATTRLQYEKSAKGFLVLTS